MDRCGGGDAAPTDAATAAALAQAEPKTPDNDATPELGAADALVQLGATGTDVGAPLEAITTDPTATAATGTATQQLVAQVAAQYNGSPIAAQVLGMIGQADAAVDVLPDAEFSSRYGRAKGIYDPATKRIALPESVLQEPELLRIVLLHEGVHWIQDNAPGGIAQVGGPLAQALQGAGALDARRTSQVDEAQAFVAEAYAAREAGIEDPGMGTSKGTPLGFDAVLARVNATPEYA